MKETATAPKRKNSKPCCKLNLKDIDLNVELYNVKDRSYYKIFHQEKIIAGTNALCITFDLKGIIHLLSHLGTAELIDHETLAEYIKEYNEEEGRGPRTEYFRNAFQTSIRSKEIRKSPTCLDPERQALKHINLHKLTRKLYIPTSNSYFSGCGGLDIGLMQAGIEIVQSVDFDDKALEIMRNNPHYFGHSIIHDDMSKKLLEGQPYTDVMHFTFPCDNYSNAADIHGTRTGDDLFHHAARHVAVRRPQVFIVENVPGMKKFKMVMETLTQMEGYYVYMFCPLDARLWLPQKRKRLILIATLKPFNIQEPVAAIKRPGIKDIIEKNVDIELTDSVRNRINGYYRDKPIIIDPNDPNAYARTCVAHYERDQGTSLVVDKSYPQKLRPFTIREYARLQGFPDDFKFPDLKTSYRYIGNAVAVDMGRWIGEMVVKYFNQDSRARSKPAAATKQMAPPSPPPAPPVPLKKKEKFEYFYYGRGTALFGDTKLYKDRLGKNGIGGIFNRGLTHPVTGQKTEGWIFRAEPQTIKEIESLFSITCQTVATKKAA